MKTITLDLNDLQWLVGAKKTDGDPQNNALFFDVISEEEVEGKEGEESHVVDINFLLAMRQGMYFEILSRVIELKVGSTEKFIGWYGGELIHLNCEVEDEPYYTQPVYTVQSYSIEFNEAMKIH